MSMHRRLKRIEHVHREGYDGGVRVLVHDPAAAAADPEAFAAFVQRVRDACPGLNDRLFIEPVRPGWVLHWPTGDDDGAVNELVYQDDMLALLDMLETEEHTQDEVTR